MDNGLANDTISLSMPSYHSIIERVIVFLLKDVARYRLKVIRSNLQSAFTYSSTQDLTHDVNKFYRFLAHVIRLFIIRPSLEKINKNLSFKSLHIVKQWLEEGKSVVICMGHVGNWELAGLSLAMQFKGQICVLYKRAKSPLINKWMHRKRHAFAGYLIESREMKELIRLIKKQPVVIVMIADQNPPNENNMMYVPFFDILTAFTAGPESLANRYQLPVVYLKNLPTENEIISLDIEIISDGTQVPETGEITKKYAQALEENIRLQKAEWLWSHKRWKRNPDIAAKY